MTVLIPTGKSQTRTASGAKGASGVPGPKSPQPEANEPLSGPPSIR